MKVLLTAGRVRSLLANAHTEQEAAAILRAHRVRYSFSTEGGAFHLRVPIRSGALSVTRTASRSAPLAITCAGNGNPLPYTVPRLPRGF